VLATALPAKVADPKAFGSSRNFAAWIGLTPGGITRAGDETLRSLLICGAGAVIQRVRRGKGDATPSLVSFVALSRLMKPMWAAQKKARKAGKLIFNSRRN
jgi:transposase